MLTFNPGSLMNIDMKIITIAGQLLGLVALIPLVVVLTLWIDARGDDGPSVGIRTLISIN